jgi:F0F1-type ATP synthase membrane subunit c/vacuolar-type H+-ATPase subunit K
VSTPPALPPGAQPPPADPRLAAKVAAVEAARDRLVADIDVLDREVRLEVLQHMESLAWKLVAGLSAAVAGIAAGKGLNAVWDRLVPGSDPPEDPTDPDTPAREALLWASLTALGVGVSTVVAQRTAAKGWVRATGRKPPAFGKRRSRRTAST